MFGYEDRRTPQQVQRDIAAADKRRSEQLIALSVLKNTIRPILKKAGIEVGLAGNDTFSSEMLLEIDEITFKLQLRIDHEE